MAYYAHIQSVHIIEYSKNEVGFCRMNTSLYQFLTDHGVKIPHGEATDREWEIDKESLRNLTDADFEDAGSEVYSYFGERLNPAAVKAFVEECLKADTGDTAYVSWF